MAATAKTIDDLRAQVHAKQAEPDAAKAGGSATAATAAKVAAAAAKRGGKGGGAKKARTHASQPAITSFYKPPPRLVEPDAKARLPTQTLPAVCSWDSAVPCRFLTWCSCTPLLHVACRHA